MTMASINSHKGSTAGYVISSVQGAFVLSAGNNDDGIHC